MVNTRSTVNPEDIIEPNLAERVTPPRVSRVYPSLENLRTLFPPNPQQAISDSSSPLTPLSSGTAQQFHSFVMNNTNDFEGETQQASNSLLGSGSKPKSPFSGDTVDPSVMDYIRKTDPELAAAVDGFDPTEPSLPVPILQGLVAKLIAERETKSTPSSAVSDLHQWEQLGKNIDPQLSIDGNNFAAWSAALHHKVYQVTCIDGWFAADRTEIDQSTANGILALLEQLVDPLLRSSLIGLTAYGAYKSLYGCFDKPSWSRLLSNWKSITQAPDGTSNLSSSYEFHKRSWIDLEKRLGGLTIDKLTALSYHSSLSNLGKPVADALDSRWAIHPDLPISSIDVLNIATRLNQMDTLDASVSAMNSRFGNQTLSNQSRRPFNRPANPSGNSGGVDPRSNNPLSLPPDNWGKKWLTPEMPCHVCWEWGHWDSDCPRVKNNQPPIENPRLKNPGWRYKKSSVLSNRLQTTTGAVASVSAVSDKADEVLTDTGATHHPLKNDFP